MKKRLLAVLLCATVAFSVCACGDSNKSTENTDSTKNSQAKEISQPTIETLADYSDLSVVLSGDYEVTEDILNLYFANVLYDNGVGVIEVTDRDTVQAGDIVKTDYTGYLNGEAFSGGAATDQWIDVSNNCGIDTSSGTSTGGFIDGFTDGLVGAKIGETTSSEVTFPEDYGNTDLAGQLTTFEFTVHEIYTEVTPENITDEFVAEHLSKIYEVNTVAEFMEFLEKELSFSYTINYVINNSTFDISEEYLYARLEDYQTYFEEIYCQSMGLSDYLSMYGYTVDEIQVEWLESVNNQIQRELVFAAMVEKDGLTIDEKGHEEYVQKVISVNSDYFPDADSIHKYAGGGNAEAGESYIKNQTAVRDNFLANYEKPAE